MEQNAILEGELVRADHWRHVAADMERRAEEALARAAEVGAGAAGDEAAPWLLAADVASVAYGVHFGCKAAGARAPGQHATRAWLAQLLMAHEQVAVHGRAGAAPFNTALGQLWRPLRALHLLWAAQAAGCLASVPASVFEALWDFAPPFTLGEGKASRRSGAGLLPPGFSTPQLAQVVELLADAARGVGQGAHWPPPAFARACLAELGTAALADTAAVQAAGAAEAGVAGLACSRTSVMSVSPRVAALAVCHCLPAGDDWPQGVEALALAGLPCLAGGAAGGEDGAELTLSWQDTAVFWGAAALRRPQPLPMSATERLVARLVAAAEPPGPELELKVKRAGVKHTPRSCLS
jgi:hypothetical protein